MELVVTAPFGCRCKEVDHDSDLGMELHGSLENPVPVGDVRENRYVKWEYEAMDRLLPPYNRCLQQLFEDKDASPRRAVDRLVVRDISGKHHAFYFDISVPLNARHERYEQAWKDREAGLPIDPRIEADFQKAIAAQKRNSKIVRL